MLQLGSIQVDARSIAGIETCIQLPAYKIAFDIGRCPRSAVKHPRIALTHAHMDHLSGVFYHAAQRKLRGVSAPTYFALPELIEPIEAIFDAYAGLHGYRQPCQLVPFAPGQRHRLSGKAELVSFATDHTLPSQGYAIRADVKKLKPEFVGLPGPEIGRLHKAGTPLYDRRNLPVFCFTGDTRIEVVEREPLVRNARVLAIEATYLDDETPVEKARERGHIHLDEIIERAELFANEHILLVHPSAKYHAEQIERILDEKLPDILRDRVTPLLPPGKP